MTETGAGYSTRAHYDRLCAELRPALAFSATTHGEWQIWRAALTERLTQLLGGFPAERVPLDPTGGEQVEADGYVRQRVTFESEPGVTVPAFLLLPTGVADDGRAPAVLCLHGHGRGKEDVVGLAASPRERQRRVRALHYDYAHRLAQRGYVVLAPDARGFGERAADGMDCAWAMTAGLLLGKTLVGMRVWDAMRAIDFLQARPEVDPDRIGCVGLSWGGTHSVYTAALDPRVKVAVVSGAFGTFKDSLIDAAECPCQYVPNLLRVADLPDLVAAIAPRAVLIEAGEDDPHYTIEVVREEYRKLRAVYDLLGADDRLALDVFPGAHRFDGRAVFPWLERWL